MKNYYYFLGVDKESSEEEIRTAYRKLSLKYHPDKNDNDLFFIKRFQEIQEAYEVLSDEEKRKNYNRNYEQNQHSKSKNPPYIKTFSCNKYTATENENIILKWQTHNANLVKIIPFGLEKSYGERIFKITQFQNDEFKILLHATNSMTKQTTVQAITIRKKNENSPSFTQIPKKTSFVPFHNLLKTRKILLSLIIILLIIYLVFNIV